MNHILRKKFVMYAEIYITDIENSSENIFIKYHRVKDHCHFTGKYTEAARIASNLNYKSSKEIPIEIS